ncbi:hypothetical protein FRC01_012639 [Tulasnella sp. 417]|nr:hypothetical protein FRC01_012639 [Tulasnella sp. 417]
MSTKNAKSNPCNQYRMQLNTIEQAGHAKFDIKNEETGPKEEAIWISVVTVRSVKPSLSKSIKIGTSYRGTGPTKSDAKDAASKEMLDLFAAFDIFPKKG